MRELLCLGISHKTAPVSLRERVALLTRDAEALCAELVELPEVDEAVAISTCNRTEVYLAAETGPAEAALLTALTARGGDSEELRAAAFRLTGRDAARHLFQDIFEFKPRFTFILLANIKPTIRGQDEGIWRRVRLMQFPDFPLHSTRIRCYNYRLSRYPEASDAAKTSVGV